MLKPNAERHAGLQGPCELHDQTHLPMLEVWRPHEAADTLGRYGLDPHRLPDSGRSRIPDLMRLLEPVLLASRLFQIMWIVESANHDLEAIGADDRFSDVGAERCVTALVRRDQLTIRPHGRVVVHGAEVQQRAFAPHTPVELEAGAVPAH